MAEACRGERWGEVAIDATGATNACASVGRPADSGVRVQARSLPACMDACRGRQDCSHVAFECGGTCELFSRTVRKTDLDPGLTREQAVEQCRDEGGLVARLGRTRCAAGQADCPEDGFVRATHGGKEVSAWSCYMEHDAAHKSSSLAWRTQPVDCGGIFGAVAGMHFQTVANPSHAVPGATGTSTSPRAATARGPELGPVSYPRHGPLRLRRRHRAVLGLRGEQGVQGGGGLGCDRDTGIARGDPPQREVGQFEAGPMAAYDIAEEILVFHHPQGAGAAARPSPSAKATSCRGEWGTWFPVHWRAGLGRHERRLRHPGTETPDRAIFQLDGGEMTRDDPCAVVMTDAGKAAIKPCGQDLGVTCRQMNAGGQCFVFVPHKNELPASSAYLHEKLQLGQRDQFSAWSADGVSRDAPRTVGGHRGYCDCNDGRWYQHFRVARQPGGGGAPCSDPPRRSVDRPPGMTGCDHMCYFQIRNDTTLRHMHGDKGEFVPGCAYENGRGWLHYSSAPCSGTQSHFSWRQGQGGHSDGIWLPNPNKQQAEKELAFRRYGSGSGTHSFTVANRKHASLVDQATALGHGRSDSSKSSEWRRNVQPRHAMAVEEGVISGGDKYLVGSDREDNTFRIVDMQGTPRAPIPCRSEWASPAGTKASALDIAHSSAPAATSWPDSTPRGRRRCIPTTCPS